MRKIFRSGESAVEKTCLWGYCCDGRRGLIEPDFFDGRDEAVAAAGEGFDETGIAGSVTERFAEPIDRGVDAVFVVDEGSFGPEFAADFLAGEDFARPVQEHAEDPEGLRVEFDAESLTAQFTGGKIDFEGAEAIAGRRPGIGHDLESSVAKKDIEAGVSNRVRRRGKPNVFR